MTRFSAFEPLQKLVQQHDSAEAEMRRLEGLKSSLSEERKKLLERGEFDDERSVAIASTLQTKASMLPFKLRQLDEFCQNVRAGLSKPIQALRGELLGERELMMRTAHDALVSAIMRELKPFLGHAPASLAGFAEDIASATLVMQTLGGIDPIWGQAEPQLMQARNLLSIAVAFERIRATFFAGEHLNLDAVANKTKFNLAA